MKFSKRIRIGSCLIRILMKNMKSRIRIWIRTKWARIHKAGKIQWEEAGACSGYNYVTPAELSDLMGLSSPQAKTTLWAHRGMAHRGMAGRIGREDLSQAFCQLMAGDLPDLDAKIQPFRQENFDIIWVF